MKIDWIECNLPWSEPMMEGYPVRPNLSQKENQLFGISYDCCEDLISSLREIIFINLFYGKAKIDLSTAEADELLAYFPENPEIKELKELTETLDKISAWQEEQPEIQKYNLECDKYEEEWMKTKHLKSFTGRKLNKPGTLIETEDGKFYLIGSGDIWLDFLIDKIVKRYAIIFEQELLDKVNNDVSKINCYQNY